MARLVARVYLDLFICPEHRFIDLFLKYHDLRVAQHFHGSHELIIIDLGCLLDLRTSDDFLAVK